MSRAVNIMNTCDPCAMREIALPIRIHLIVRLSYDDAVKIVVGNDLNLHVLTVR